MNRLDKAHQAQAIRCLIEGNSIRSTVRMTGVAKNTVVKLLVAVGSALSRYQDEKLRNLHCQRIQCDEIWSFVYARQKNVTSEIADPQIAGDVWTWTAIDAETKLIPCWLVGKRDAVSAEEFIKDLAGRLENRVQLTTDRLKVYLSGIVGAFDEEIDYAILHKIYGADRQTEARYSPAICTGCEKKPTIGDPDPKHISTGYVERQNFTMRMSMRRFTRLTNAFSKKVEDHAASIALYLMWYNFGRIQQTLKMTPAMRSGLSFTLWTVEEILALADGSASD
ncbi:MAG TPA: DDE-type integrase/transposase/recombinase [Bryobacteraceae bacterium]|nr:DDE-type integrase/transposase/recombinase [Bryobacteraceae bacterium]